MTFRNKQLLSRAVSNSMVSFKNMRRIISRIPIVLLTAGLWAQSSTADKAEQAAIRRAKNALVSSMDRSLPKVSLEYFLRYESKGAAIHWEVNDCGEQSGNPAMDRGRDFPTCVEADFEVDHRAVSIFISVGSVKTGAAGAPALFSATITDSDGMSHLLKQLGELPMSLHRPLRREPRDLPDPAGAL